MRESIGGTWILSIAIIFISLFSAFLSYSISYTKAFNLKNYIVEEIEKEEGYTSSSLNDDEFENYVRNEDYDTTKITEEKIFKYMDSLGYNYTTAEKYMKNNGCKISDENGNVFDGYAAKGGYCVIKFCTIGTNKNTNTHYKVKTFISVDISFLNIQIAVPIQGETRTLYYDYGNLECAKTY